MSTRLSSIVRRPEGLFAVLVSRLTPFTPPKPNGENKGRAEPAIIDESPFFEETAPLQDVPAALYPEKKELLRSWEELRVVEVLDSTVAASVLHILAETVLVPIVGSNDIPVQVPDESPSPCRPTAAHPRAYRGTKYKPPKTSKPEPVNLQLSLCSAAEENRLLARLAPYFEDGLKLLKTKLLSSGLTPERLQMAAHCHENFLSLEYRKRVASLPSIFLRDLYWNLRTCDWDAIVAVLSAYWALELEQKASLRNCVSILLGAADDRRTIAWCQLIAQIPPERRVAFTELLIESGAFEVEPGENITRGLVHANSLSSDDVYQHRMYYALRCVRAKCGLDYANDGFLLANKYYANFLFEEVASIAGAFEAVEPFAEFVSVAENWWPRTPLILWKRCSELEGFRELLQQLKWRKLDPGSALKFIEILGDVLYEGLGEKKLKRKWQCIRKWACHMLEALVLVEQNYRSKALDGLGNMLWMLEEPEELDSAVKPFCKLLARLCAAPFRQNSYSYYPITAFTILPAEDWEAIEVCNDASFLTLESECARKNDAILIENALWTMCHLHPRLTATAFFRHPKQLLKAAHTLGVLEVPTRREVVRAFASHPLITCNIAGMAVEALVELVDMYTKDGVADPVPKRLREHINGGKELRPNQVERDLAKIRDGWLALQIDVLNQVAYDRLNTGLPFVQRTSTVRHALMIQQGTEENRRSLRRLLKATLCGHKPYASQHPQNLTWLKKHPRIDPAKWAQGVIFSAGTMEYGMLDLSIEQDPLEVLRLGSYFGTCLGVGGMLCYSAAAITLDINKQVVYARSSTGRVVARQLLAIAEDGRLVCFEVYPTSAKREVRQLFREYDLCLAQHLGIEICKGLSEADDDDYEIACPVSNGFWDDSAWDLEISDE